MRGDRDRLLDMIEMCDLLIRHASDRAALGSDPVIQAAAQRWIEVLGEAGSHVSDETRKAHPEIPWRGIIGQAVDRDVPALRSQLLVVADDVLGD